MSKPLDMVWDENRKEIKKNGTPEGPQSEPRHGTDTVSNNCVQLQNMIQWPLKTMQLPVMPPAWKSQTVSV